MANNRILTALAVALLLSLSALAQSPAPATPTAETKSKTADEPPTEAEKQIDEAIAKLAGLKSASAELVETVEMLGQKFDILGVYLKGPEHRIYLKLAIKGLVDSTGTMLQVCDGTTLWDYQQVLENQSYRKRSITPIFKKLDAPDFDPKLRERVVSSLGFTGPDTLLLGLRKAIHFDQKEETTLDGIPVWQLNGTWVSREGLMGVGQQPLPALAPLPAYVPSVVTVYIGKEDGWPYKVVMLGKVPNILEDDRPIGPDGRRLGAKVTKRKVQRTSIVLVYSKVQINPALKIDEFVFRAPPDAHVEDETDAILTNLEQAVQMETARKKAEAARAGEPLDGGKEVDGILKQSIEVPKSEPK